jgi:MSHA pilin protein MshC
MKGFTYVEFVAVCLLLVIIVTIALPKLSINLSNNRLGFTDQLRGVVLSAQKTAIATRRNVCVNVTASSITLKRAASAGTSQTCSIDLPDPMTGSNTFSLNLPVGLALQLTSTPLIFGAQGEPLTNSGVVSTTNNQLVLSGTQNLSITISQTTGHVY